MSGVPLTPAQEMICAGQVLAGARAIIYNMPMAFRLNGPLDPERLKGAIRAVEAGAQTLRSRFVIEEGRIAQRFDASPGPIDLMTFDGDEAAALNWCRERAALPFDLSEGTWRSTILSLGAEQHIWFWCQHHIACDLGGLLAMLDHVSAAYQGGSPPLIPDFSAQFPTLEHECGVTDFWSEAAGKGAGAAAPYGALRGSDSGASSRYLTQPEDWLTPLLAMGGKAPYQALSPDLGHFQLLATAMIAWLHRVTGDTRIALGALAHNRASAEAKATPGFFMELFPLIVDVAPEDSFHTLYAKTRIAVRRIHARRGGVGSCGAQFRARHATRLRGP